MKITFDNALYTGTDYKTTQSTPQAAKNMAAGGSILDITDNRGMSAYSFGKSKGLQGLSKDEMLQALGGENMAVYRNYMTVMSNTMSDEDFAKMQEDGYHPMDLHPEEASDILDSIKAELIKAGVDIKGYTDNMDKEVLASLTGSVTYANALLHAFANEDIPFSEENIKEATKAVDRGLDLNAMTDGVAKFMLTNELAPTIDNLYLAEHVGAKDAKEGATGYFFEDLPGYVAKSAKAGEAENLRKQIEKVVEKAGLPVSEETTKEGMWLVEKGIPLTEESLKQLHDLNGLSLPVTDEKVCSAVAAAMAEGRPASEANLLVEKSIYRRAVDFYTAHRNMEEIRLHMTVDANLKLLKSGFAIDTAPIEQTIEALKALEENQQKDIGSTTFGSAELCRETMEKVREIPYLPAATLGRMISMGESFSVEHIYATGKMLAEEFKKANEAYETMFTEIRGDLGDSMKKAFRSVDNLLTNMGIELTDDNRKAVRSLSYNKMELTPENIRKVKEAEAAVMKVVKKMTPMSVLNMIRDEINPLKASFEELEDYFNSYDSYAEDSEKYSRFLYRMEQNGEISAEEKESFIGVYRLLHQLQKSDGAAVAKLVDTGAEVNFKNLLSAIRTGKVHGIDVSMDKEFGGLKEAVTEGLSIDAQIDRAYGKQMLKEIRSLKDLDTDAVKLLQKIETPVTMENLLAAGELKKDRSVAFKKLKTFDTTAATTEDTAAVGRGDTEAASLKDFQSGLSEEIFSSKESLQTTYDAMMEKSIQVMKEQTFMETTDVNVQMFRMSCKQLSIQRSLAAKEEEYDLPLTVSDEIMAVHVKFIHDTKEKGSFTISMEDEVYGTFFGNFSMKEDVLSGFFAASEEDLEILLETKQIFADKLNRAGIKAGNLEIVTGNRFTDKVSEGNNEIETGKLYKAAGLALHAVKESLQSKKGV